MEFGGTDFSSGRTRRRNSRYQTGDFADVDALEDELEEDEEEEEEIMPAPRYVARAQPIKKAGVGRPNKSTKVCPSCEEPVRNAGQTVCSYCDYVFTSATRAQEEVPVTERFGYEAEREEDGSKKVELILGRRRLRPGGSNAAAAHHLPGRGNKLPSPSASSSNSKANMNKGVVPHRPALAVKDPRREKYYYEYRVKYKNVSYLKTEWLTYHQIDSLGTRSKQCLSRWLKKLEKGETEDIEDGTFDHSYCVVEKVLDCADAEIEVSDDEGEDEAGGAQEQQASALMESPQMRGRIAAAKSGNHDNGTNGGAVAASAVAEPNPRLVDPFIEGRPSGKGWFPMVRCRYVFNRIVEDDFSDWFYESVDTMLYSDYLSIVEKSMCLAWIKDKLEQPDAYNGDPRLFAADMRLIWRNCEEYNGQTPHIAVFQAGEMFNRIFERLYQTWVMAFKEGTATAVDWDSIKARPWEYKCVKCAKDSDESHLLMCDSCDAEYHTYCLSPSLVDVPIGLWLCPRCEVLDLEAKGSSHSHASEEAWREKVYRALKERKIVMQRLYLVKWKDLGYAYCTWEKPEDLNDDAKIEEYHRVNDAPPQEAAIPQEELFAQLSKRHYNYAPALKQGDEQKELELQVYAQIRAAHFLKWGMIPPSPLLHDCGPLIHAYSLLEETHAASGGQQHEAVRQEVAILLTELVDHCAKGSLPPSPGPPQRTGEYDVSFYRIPGETLSLNIGNYRERVVVMGFRAREDGTVAPLERSGRITANDVLVAINGESVMDIPFREVIDKLGKVSGYMTLRFVNSHNRDNYLDTGSQGTERLGGTTKKEKSLPRLGFRDEFIPQPISNAITPMDGGTDWSAKIRVADRIQELGKFKSKHDAVNGFKAAVNKYYKGQDALAKYGRSLEAFVLNDGMNHVAPMEEHFADSSASELEDGLPIVQNQETLSSWAGLGQAGRLARAVTDCDTAPDPAKWSNALYFREEAPKTFTTTSSFGKTVKWVEMLDMINLNPVRIFQSVSEAHKNTGIPVHILHAALQQGQAAGGYKWRYADEATVAAHKHLWSQRSHVGARGEDGEEEPWKKKLPNESKVFKDGNKLRDYQLLGVQWLLKCWYQRRSCILADEMGLGKTVQIVTMLEHIYSVDGLPGPFLVVVPLSTIEHWRREFASWTDMRFCMYYDVGGARGMRDVMREYEWYYKNRSRRMLKIHVLVTTYEALIKDYEEIAEIPWRCIIVDEAHRLRNWKGKLHECLKVVSQTGQQAYGYQHRVLMTGTPLQNNTQELWSLLHYIEPTKFPDLDKFNERYGRVETVEQVQNLQKRLEPHLLRRVKEDVASDIPPKEETIIDIELTTLQKQYYRAIFERNHAFLYNKAGNRGVLPKLMNIQMELRKCCNHPFLVEGVEDAEMERLAETITDPFELDRARVEHGLVATSGKMVLIDKLLPKLRREDHKVLIFSQMIRVLDLLEEFCDKRGFPVERLDGRVTGNQRQQAIDRFNTNPESFVFLLSTRAGGVGINLTAADTVIIFDSDWNPQNDVQAQARCHRIGQTKEVQVYRLITRKSFEFEMFDRASKKLGLENAILGGHNFRDDGDGSSEIVDRPSNKEMEQLLRQGAYSLLDDDDDEAREFCEDDIDKIMKERTHRVQLDAPSKGANWLTKKAGAFRKRAFTAGGDKIEVDVNDPDFWAKVMPDLKTPEALERRWAALEQEDDEDVMKSFFEDLASMVNRLIDLNERDKCPPRDRDAAVMLLIKVGAKEELITPEQKLQTEVWKSSLEGSRVRSCRQELLGDSDDEIVPTKRRRNRSVNKEDNHSDVCMVCFQGGSLIMCEGKCKRAFHLACLGLDSLPAKKWICEDCTKGVYFCLVCEGMGDMDKEGGVFKCKKPTCGRFYHPQCIEGDDRVRKFKSQADKFICAQHICAVCKERPGLKPDRENFFLQCVKCPTAQHLKCALGKPVDVLTHRSMVCEAHAGEHGKPPLEMTAVGHIKYPERRRRSRAPKAGSKGGEDEDDDDDEEEGGATKKKRGGRPRKHNKVNAVDAMQIDSGDDEKKGGGKRLPIFTSRVIGPFQGENYELAFMAVVDEEKRVKGDNSQCPCGRTDETGSEHYICCKKCGLWQHLRCAGLEEKEAAQITNYYCDKCDEDEEGYKPLVRIQYQRVPVKRVAIDGFVKREKASIGAKKTKIPAAGNSSVSSQVNKEENSLAKFLLAGIGGGGASAAVGGEGLYCICKQPEKPGDQYLSCDQCAEWFHHKCMGLNPEEMSDQVAWICPSCRGNGGGGGAAYYDEYEDEEEDDEDLEDEEEEEDYEEDEEGLMPMKKRGKLYV